MVVEEAPQQLPYESRYDEFAAEQTGFALKLLINGGKFDFSAPVSRGEGAAILYDYINQ